MALSIKNDEYGAPGSPGRPRNRRVSDPGDPEALRERWERLKAGRRSRVLTGQLEDLLRRVDALPTLDSRPEDEILGYDEHGVPR